MVYVFFPRVKTRDYKDSAPMGLCIHNNLRRALKIKKLQIPPYKKEKTIEKVTTISYITFSIINY